MPISYRPILSNEHLFLEEMLYEALFVPEGQPKYPRSVTDNPDLRKYVEDWSRDKYDLAIVALDKKELIGAIWESRQIYSEKYLSLALLHWQGKQ